MTIKFVNISNLWISSSNLLAKWSKFLVLINDEIYFCRESKVLKRTLQCGALNGGIFLFSMWAFEYGLLPIISLLLRAIFGTESTTGKRVWYWTEPFLSLVFKTCWVIPLFLLSKIVNSLWFQVCLSFINICLYIIIYNFFSLYVYNLYS